MYAYNLHVYHSAAHDTTAATAEWGQMQQYKLPCLLGELISSAPNNEPFVCQSDTPRGARIEFLLRVKNGTLLPWQLVYSTGLLQVRAQSALDFA